jgi:hypothetical protein
MDTLIYYATRGWAGILLLLVLLTGMNKFSRVEGCYFCRSHGPEHLIGCTHRALIKYVLYGQFEQSKHIQ